MRPLILISNDDGIHSPGLNALADCLRDRHGCDVVVSAPERERSAAGHAITLHKPLRVTESTTDRYAVSGTPVDCVYLALLELVPRRPDLVLSGINRGYNLGSDVFYSGTVAAAVEAALRKLPAIAFSLDHAADNEVVRRAAAFSSAVVATALDRGFPAPGAVLNVNLPIAIGGESPGYRWTRLGNRAYRDLADKRTDSRGRSYYWIGGGVESVPNPSDTDCGAIDDGVASLTPLTLDLTDRAALATLSALEIPGYVAR